MAVLLFDFFGACGRSADHVDSASESHNDVKILYTDFLSEYHNHVKIYINSGIANGIL